MWGLGCIISELTFLTSECVDVDNRKKILFIENEKEKSRLSEMNQKGSSSTDDQSIETISAHLLNVL